MGLAHMLYPSALMSCLPGLLPFSLRVGTDYCVMPCPFQDAVCCLATVRSAAAHTTVKTPKRKHSTRRFTIHRHYKWDATVRMSDCRHDNWVCVQAE